jgi:hypothetical protein
VPHVKQWKNGDSFIFILSHTLSGSRWSVRYYGFLANVCKQKAIALIRRLISKYLEVATFACENPREKMLRLTGRDILLC